MGSNLPGFCPAVGYWYLNTASIPLRGHVPSAWRSASSCLAPPRRLSPARRFPCPAHHYLLPAYLPRWPASAFHAQKAGCTPCNLPLPPADKAYGTACKGGVPSRPPAVLPLPHPISLPAACPRCFKASAPPRTSWTQPCVQASAQRPQPVQFHSMMLRLPFPRACNCPERAGCLAAPAAGAARVVDHCVPPLAVAGHDCPRRACVHALHAAPAFGKVKLRQAVHHPHCTELARALALAAPYAPCIAGIAHYLAAQVRRARAVHWLACRHQLQHATRAGRDAHAHPTHFPASTSARRPSTTWTAPNGHAATQSP